MENVNHPAHYNQGKFEVMDVIEEDEKWYKVIYDNQTGYVAKSQMTKYE